MPLRKLLRKLCGDRKESKADSPPPLSPRPSTIKPTQSTEPFKPQDLWQTAYDQLDEEKRNILSTPKDTAEPNNKENQARIEDLISQVIHLTKEQYEEYQQNADGKIRTYSRTIIDAALSTKDIISAVATFDSTQHAASAWAIVSLGLTMTKNYRDQRDALFESSDYLADVLAQCASVEQNFYRKSRSDNQQDFGNILIRLYRAILSYTAVVQQTQSASKGRKLLDCVSAITDHPLTELKALVEEERKKLHWHIELDEYLRRGEEAENILYKIDELAESMKLLVERFSLVNLRVAEGALYNSYINQHEDFCLPDTRTDLQRQILEWAKSDGKFIFWLNGMAGTGKSTIARTVAHLLKNQRMLGATFFFKRGEADRGNAKLLVSTIAVQLVSRHRQLLPAVLDAIKNDTNIAFKSLGEQFDKLIYQPLVQQHTDQSRMIVIVIDALDECDRGDDMRLILRLLFQLQEIKTVHLRVLLTSRPELPIRLGFKKEVNHQDLLLHELPTEMIRHDIRVFLKYKLSEIRDERELSFDWPGQENIERLVNMAVPLFIFAATLCRFVGDTDWLPQERLLAVLQDKAATSASEMERTYLPVLNQLVASKSKRDCAALLQEFQDIIGVIILLASPLSVVSLAQLTGKSKDSISNRLNKFHAVLNIPKNPEKPVRILHLSFRDFLVSTESDFYINEHETHGKIALHCLQLMETRLKHNICGLASYGTQRKDINPQIIKQHLTAELQYSSRYWVYHLEQSEGRISQSEILAFLKKRFLHWLEALALIESISDAVGMIDTLKSSIWTSIGVETSDFLYDAKRFVLQNTYIAGIAPLQLYSSGLVFAPAQSIVKKTFSSEVVRQIKSLPVLENSWSPILQTLEGHSNLIYSVAFSPDGRTLASGSRDNTIKLWNTTTGTERQTLEGHLNLIYSLAFSPDGRTLALGSADDTIKLWDTTTGTERQTLEGHLNFIYSLAFSPDGRTLASGSADDTIKLWDTTTGTERHTLEGHLNLIYSLAFSPDGRTLALGSADDTIKLWDTTTGTERQTLEGHLNSIESVAFSPDGRTLASGSHDNTIKLWDTTTGTERHTLEGHSDWVKSVAFSPDGHTLASGSRDNTIKLWDTTTGTERQTLESHSNWVYSVAFSPDGRTLASGSRDNTIKLWDTTMGTERQTLESHSNWVYSVVFSPDGHTLASGSDDNTIKLWDTTTGTERQTLKGHSNFIYSLAFSPDGRTLASGSRDNTIKLWDTMTGTERHTLKSHLNLIYSLVFSPDGRTLASGSADNTIKLWDTMTGTERHTLKGHSNSIYSLAFSPDGCTLASGSADNTIKLWNTTTGTERHTLKGHSNFIYSLAFSPDGRTLASGSADNTIKLWNTMTGTERHTLKGHLNLIYSVAFSPDGCTLASGSADDTIKLWDTTTGTERQTLEGHSGSVETVLNKTTSHPQVSLSNTWISSGGENLLWLPAEYRSFLSYAVKDTTIALGYRDGRVCIIGFHS